MTAENLLALCLHFRDMGHAVQEQLLQLERYGYLKERTGALPHIRKFLTEASHLARQDGDEDLREGIRELFESLDVIKCLTEYCTFPAAEGARFCPRCLTSELLNPQGESDEDPPQLAQDMK